MIKNILTGKDNSTYDVARVGFLLTLGVFLSNATYIVFKTGSFDMNAFGIGVGAITAGFGALLKLKEGSEPDGNTGSNK